jgi:hypothetical protein
MKKTLALIFTCLISIQGFSIDIVDIFYLIPTNIDLEIKKELVDFYNQETAKIKESERQRTDCKDLINVIDKSNGFLSLSIHCGDGGIEICYWNRECGDKIIAVNQFGYATSKFTQTIDFYLLKEDSVIAKLDSDIIVPYEEIRTELLKSELNDKLTKEAKQHGLFENEAIVFELPRFGKVIKASYGLDNSGNWLAKFLDNKTCELSWIDLKLVLK